MNRHFETVLVLLFTLTIGAQTNLILTSKLKFTVSGRSLNDLDGYSTTDGYVDVYYTNDNGKTIKFLGRTEVIMDRKNPNWKKEFEFHFDRRLKQHLLFHVLDHDPFKFDDTVGKVWINVADFVDKSQVDYPNLDNGGYLAIKALPGTHKSNRKGQPGILPFRRETTISKRIKFKVSTRALSRNANHHETLVVFLAEGPTGKEKRLGVSTTVTASINPLWKDVYSINWNRNKDQRLHFKVYDTTNGENLQDSDIIGNAWIQVNDFIAKGDRFTVLLPQKGSLTITRE